MKRPFISAVITTCDRPEYLRKAIQSLVVQSLPKSDYEILVVDNGSNPKETRWTVKNEFKNASNLCYVRQARRGHSKARNRGWKAAKGIYVAYLDDDAVAAPRWLEKILNVFDSVEPLAGCVGGKVNAIWESQWPSWLSHEMMSYLSLTAPGREEGFLKPHEWLVGTNFAFPKHVLEIAGGFEERLGRRGEKLLSNDDIWIQKMLNYWGYKSYFHPNVEVWHHVPQERLCQKWFRQRWYWQGVSDANLLVCKKSIGYPMRLWLAGYEIKKLILSFKKVVTLLFQTQDPKTFSKKTDLWVRLGYIAGLLKISK